MGLYLIWVLWLLKKDCILPHDLKNCIFCSKPCCFSSRPTTVLLTYASTSSSISFCKGFLNFNAYICYACFLALTILLLLHNIVARNPINLKNMLSYTLIKGWIALFCAIPVWYHFFNLLVPHKHLFVTHKWFTLSKIT